MYVIFLLFFYILFKKYIFIYIEMDYYYNEINK
jgi:hypothetical protein